MKLYIIINSSHKMSNGFIAGQASHIVSLFLYHGYIKQDWQALPELPNKQTLNHYFNAHITKIILKAPEEKLLELRNQNYLVIDDFNKQSNKTITFKIKNSNKEIVAKDVSEQALSNAKNHQNQDSYTYDIKTKADGSIQSFKNKTSHLDYKLIFTMLVPVFVVMILLNLD